MCICTKFGIGGRLVDVYQLCRAVIDRFKGIDFVGGGIPNVIVIEGRC